MCAACVARYRRKCERLGEELDVALRTQHDNEAVLKESKKLETMKQRLFDMETDLTRCEEERNQYMTRCQLLEQQLVGEPMVCGVLFIILRCCLSVCYARAENKSQFAEQLTSLQQLADAR